MKKQLSLVVGLLLLTCLSGQPCAAAKPSKQVKNLRILYWNIQLGMWDGQGDNYDRFVSWINEKNPDICVWCEAESICKTGSDESLPDEERYLPKHWPELAARYGHSYVFMSGKRDAFPQVVTSKYPIDTLGQFIGSAPDSVVMHGAGWARVRVEGKQLNIVTLHLQPFNYWRFLPKEQKEESAKNYGGEKYRRMEMKWILNHTVRTSRHPEKENWMMLGDYNACSRKDNFHYKWSDASQSFLTHNYIEVEAPYYYDLIAESFPGLFCPSHYAGSRIDYIYCTEPVLDAVTRIVYTPDSYTKPVYSGVNKFRSPSDHYPYILDIKLSKLK